MKRLVLVAVLSLVMTAAAGAQTAADTPAAGAQHQHGQAGAAAGGDQQAGGQMGGQMGGMKCGPMGGGMGGMMGGGGMMGQMGGGMMGHMGMMGQMHGTAMMDMMHMMKDMMEIQERMLTGVPDAEKKRLLKELSTMRERLDTMMAGMHSMGGMQHGAAPQTDQKPEQKKDAPKKDAQKKEAPRKAEEHKH